MSGAASNLIPNFFKGAGRYLQALRWGMPMPPTLARLPILAFRHVDDTSRMVARDDVLPQVSEEQSVFASEKPPERGYLEPFALKALARGRNVRVGCDETIGGGSTASVEVLEEPNGRHHLKFRGILDTNVPRGASRSGYAAVVYTGELDFGGFSIIELRLRSHVPRRYTLMINAQTLAMVDASYQKHFLTSESRQWETHSFELRDLVKTKAGMRVVSC